MENLLNHLMHLHPCKLLSTSNGFKNLNICNCTIAVGSRMPRPTHLETQTKKLTCYLLSFHIKSVATHLLQNYPPLNACFFIKAQFHCVLCFVACFQFPYITTTLYQHQHTHETHNGLTCNSKVSCALYLELCSCSCNACRKQYNNQ